MIANLRSLQSPKLESSFAFFCDTPTFKFIVQHKQLQMSENVGVELETNL